MTNTASNEIRIGSIIRVTIDGLIGKVTHANAHGVTIVHDDMHNGRGPWPMWRSQVELATEAESAAYAARCLALAAAVAA